MSVVIANLSAIAAVLAVMAVLAVVETAIPLHRRGPWHRLHLAPNLALTLLTFLTNFGLNAGVVLWLRWLDTRGFGLLRGLGLDAIAAALVAVLALELGWYALHRSMHRVPALWNVHRVHHSDPVVDVTTTARQHPVESVLRYAVIASVVTVLGVGLGAFTLYRLWSALNGLWEHANVRLPRWLDRGLALVTVSPDMHKVHHSRDVRETDTNYGNILSLYDRILGTFTPTERGRSVVCGLAGHDEPASQTTSALLAMPCKDRVGSRASVAA